MQQAIAHPEDRPASAGAADHWLGRVRLGSIVAIVIGVLLMMSVLPVSDVINSLESWIAGLGLWGPAAFVLMYVLATVVMVPGAALTMAAGAIFGLVKGTVVVSLGSTFGAALAFVIGRTLARDRIAGLVRQHPKFNAIDKAVGQGGWKIVAMLRLSPVVPFNIQNYLYGLTAIRFWPAILASWVAMLPGTFLFVYLGYLGRVGAVAAAGGDAPGNTGQVILMGVGLTATVAVTVYITRLATRAVSQHTQQGEQADTCKEKQAMHSESQHGRLRRPRTLAAIAVIGLLVLAGGVYARLNPEGIRAALLSFSGPPAVVMTEAYPADEPGITDDDELVFDHAPFDALLSKHVDPDGWVDYKALAEDPAALDAYIVSLADAPFDELGRDEKLAFLINAYNAFTLRLILDHYPVKSIKDISSARRWEAVRWALPGGVVSLNQIEHELIRPRFAEPRIHFALVCAAYSCPKLRNEAYTGDRLEDQLQDQTDYTHTHDRWLRFDQADNTVYLTALYNWYGSDFETVADSVLDFVAGQVPALREAMASGDVPKVRWLDYDWKLNDVHNAP